MLLLRLVKWADTSGLSHSGVEALLMQNTVRAISPRCVSDLTQRGIQTTLRTYQGAEFLIDMSLLLVIEVVELALNCNKALLKTHLFLAKEAR